MLVFLQFGTPKFYNICMYCDITLSYIKYYSSNIYEVVFLIDASNLTNAVISFCVSLTNWITVSILSRAINKSWNLTIDSCDNAQTTYEEVID